MNETSLPQPYKNRTPCSITAHIVVPS